MLNGFIWHVQVEFKLSTQIHSNSLDENDIICIFNICPFSSFTLSLFSPFSNLLCVYLLTHKVISHGLLFCQVNENLKRGRRKWTSELLVFISCHIRDLSNIKRDYWDTAAGTGAISVFLMLKRSRFYRDRLIYSLLLSVAWQPW